ncbi:unnamed protein product, partial [Ectocarpus fasciculatus]
VVPSLWRDGDRRAFRLLPRRLAPVVLLTVGIVSIVVFCLGTVSLRVHAAKPQWPGHGVCHVPRDKLREKYTAIAMFIMVRLDVANSQLAPRGCCWAVTMLCS